MRRYLIVAHQTLGGDHLIEHVRALREEGPCRFLLLVPVEHPSDHPWTDGEVTAAARRSSRRASTASTTRASSPTARSATPTPSTP